MANKAPLKVVPMPDLMSELKEGIDQYCQHLVETCAIFNAHAASLGMGVTVSADKAIQGVRSGLTLAKVHSFFSREDDSGVLHDAQLMTALDCVKELLEDRTRSGLVLGAMQSGKTTTSLALQFAGPIVYLLTGRKFYPIYLITSQTSQEDQTRIELQKFIDYYGDLEIIRDEKHRCTLVAYTRLIKETDQVIDAVFRLAPTVNTYRSHILRNALPDVLLGPRLEDFVQRRVHGERAVGKVADLCRRANAARFWPLLIIDEPQYGASDRYVEDANGDLQRRACVLVQIFDAIKKALGRFSGEQVFVGLSATPFELHDIEAVWTVRQYLTPEYTGFNYFGGKVISDGIAIAPPRTVSFGDFSRDSGISFIEKVSLAAYKASPAGFQRHANKIGYSGDQEDFRVEVEDSVREAVEYMASHGTTPNVGICVRLFNDNARSHEFLQRLRLNPSQIEIVEYFGSDHRGHSVKRALQARRRPDLPFLIAVTNRARMADAFPASVEWFLEFSEKASDLNALLQGLLGRACGYGKHSTVVMSNDNIDIVDDYKRTGGQYVYKTSRHSKVVGGYRRGAPTNLIRVPYDDADPVLRAFFTRLETEVVQPRVLQGKPILSTTRAPKGFRTAPILKIAEETGLFDYVERPEVRSRLFPTYPDFRIVRSGEKVRNPRDGRLLSYFLDENGNCRFTFRWWTPDEGAHSGIRSRGYGERDSSDRDKAGDTLEPQVNMRKFDTKDGSPIDDKSSKNKSPGRWKPVMVTLPLVTPVRELRPGDATYPVEESPFAELMSKDERKRAGYN